MPRRPKRTKTLIRFGYDVDVYETVSAASQAKDGSASRCRSRQVTVPPGRVRRGRELRASGHFAGTRSTLVPRMAYLVPSNLPSTIYGGDEALDCSGRLSDASLACLKVTRSAIADLRTTGGTSPRAPHRGYRQ